MRFPEFTARVSPRATNAPLYPEDIDKTLSSLTLNIDVFTDGDITSNSHKVSERIFDRLQVIILKDEQDLSTLQSPKAQEIYNNQAIRAGNVFLDHCRIITGYPFISRIEQSYNSNSGLFGLVTPHTVTWFNSENNDRLPVYEGGVNGHCSSGELRAPVTGNISMRSVEESLQSSPDPDICKLLIVDAKEYLATLRIREALVAIASACEIASTRYIDKASDKDRSKVDTIESKRNTFAEKRFHLIPSEVSGRSLQLEDKATYLDIKNAYKARNKVAHEGRAYFMADGTEVLVDVIMCYAFINSAKKGIDWINALPI